MYRLNYWLSEYTGCVYYQDAEILPQFGGWTLLGTQVVDTEAEAEAWLRYYQKKA